jgi:hypothetical protein
MTDVSSGQPRVSKSFRREFKNFPAQSVLEKKKKKKKKLNKFPCTSRQARKFDPFSIMHKNFHRSYRHGNWGVTVGSRVNHIRAQQTLARLEAQKTLQAQHPPGRKTRDSNSRPTRPPGLRLSNSRLPVRDLLRRQ